LGVRLRLATSHSLRCQTRYAHWKKSSVPPSSSVAGPLVAGFFADLTGNYRLGFTMLALTACAGSVLFLLAKPPQLPKDG
jgi:hypothetical protein